MARPDGPYIFINGQSQQSIIRERKIIIRKQYLSHDRILGTGGITIVVVFELKPGGQVSAGTGMVLVPLIGIIIRAPVPENIIIIIQVHHILRNARKRVLAVITGPGKGRLFIKPA